MKSLSISGRESMFRHLNAAKWADPGTKVWRTGDGENIHVERMGDLHIRKVVEFLNMNYIDTTHSCDEWESAAQDCTNEHLIEAWARAWIRVMQDEWNRRGFREMFW